MKEFKNIPSKIFQHTEKWVKNEKEVTKNKYGENQNLENEINKIKKRPMSSTSRSVQPRMTINFTKEDPSKKLSMFEEYYKQRLIEEKILPNPEEEKKYEELEEIKDNYDHELKEMKHIQNIEEQMNAQYESIKKAQLKEATPSSKDLGMILPKTPRNYIKENKNLIHEQKVPNKVKPEKQIENPYHKSYGKTPLYIKNMRIEAEIRKEIAQQKKIESKYPKGTRLLSEEERQKTLSGLYESQKEIMDLIEKLPISMGTRASKAKKDELYRKLDEIEEAIKTFSRDQVFVKIDS